MGAAIAQRVWFMSKGLKFLKPVLGRLKELHQEYIDCVPGDVPYWYGERPQIGLLAAAVWRSGGVALEEYCRKRPGRPRKGRCDLFLSIAGIGCECEAKIVKRFDEIGPKLDRAEREVQQILQPGDKGLALVFFVPVTKDERVKKRPIGLASSRNCIKSVLFVTRSLGQEFVLATRYLPFSHMRRACSCSSAKCFDLLLTHKSERALFMAAGYRSVLTSCRPATRFR
jgi:hypothetical protein